MAPAPQGKTSQHKHRNKITYINMNIEKGRNAQDWLNEDPLNDTISHALMRSSEPLRERIVEAGEDRIPNQTEEIAPAEIGQQERAEAHPSTIPTGVPCRM
ncbi:hypothetical protein NC651_018245 [Populus alba x Populus x berolinensis]|nr:hypothetical protein NC651_018245 [Populus alba x Populus x berolinensis]